MFVVHLLVVAAVVALQVANPPAMPESLRRMMEARLALRTGQVEWSMEEHLEFPESVSPYPWRELAFTSQFGSDTVLRVNRGDCEGVVVPNEDRIIDAASTATRSSLREGQRLWTLVEGRTIVETYHTERGTTGVPDLRSLGFFPGQDYSEIGDAIQHLRRGDEELKYSETTDSGLHVVTASSTKGAYSWWIDPERGWSPVRSVFKDESGRIVLEQRSALKDYDGTWFPEQVEFFSAAFEDGKTPQSTVFVANARFNQPDQPLRLTPADIGVEVGMRIADFDDKRELTNVSVWDGARRVTEEEFRDRLLSGELRYGPAVLRAFARSDMAAREARRRDEFDAKRREAQGASAAGAPVTTTRPSPGLASIPLSEWERYTRDFIRKYVLDADQTAKALQILEDCQERAEHVGLAQAEKLRALEKRSATVSSLSGTAQQRELTAIAQERERLMAPIMRIEREQLHPRLEQLLTRAQRSAATTTTQPVTDR